MATTQIGAQTWDKTFPQSDQVTVEKVSFKNRYDLTVVGDLYLPKGLDRTTRHAAIVVGHPFGGVKEQSSGLYAQQLALRGFVALAFDLSYGGESGGTPRHTASPETYVDDFSAAVDFVGTQGFVDRSQIGAIGICGSGGFGVAAAAIDPRIRAIATVSMYDMGRERRQGFLDAMGVPERKAYLEQIAEQRWKEADGEPIRMLMGTADSIDDQSPAVVREFFDYYRTPRGQHPRCTTGITYTSSAPMMNFWPFANIELISPRPVLFIAGENAHSRYFSEDAYKLASEPKELYIVPGAGHVDLYDRLELIPFDKIASFFNRSMTTPDQTIFGKGELATANFTGDAWVKHLVQQRGYDCMVYNVTFAPGVRNHWHTHSVGQILLCTDGEGYYQQRGKAAQRLSVGSVVEIPAGAEHWHGAATGSQFTHIGITPKASENQVKWLGEVTDEEYKQAVK